MRCSKKGVRTEKTDRECGFLTESEREYLVNDKLPNYDYAESRKRNEITTRTLHAFHDLILIQKHGDEELKDAILNEDNRDVMGKNRELLEESLVAIMADLAAGEYFTEAMFWGLKRMEEEGWGQKMFEAIEAAAEGKQTKTLNLFFEVASELFNVPEKQAKQLFNQQFR